jgi:hypothetical protein
LPRVSNAGTLNKQLNQDKTKKTEVSVSAQLPQLAGIIWSHWLL